MIEYKLENDLTFGILKFNEIGNYDLLLNFITNEINILNSLTSNQYNNYMEDVINSASIMYENCRYKKDSYFSYIRHNNNILMSMVVYYDNNHKDVNYKHYKFQYHIGIHRNLEDIVNNKTITHKNISMQLHWGACKAIQDLFGINENIFVIINPLSIMHNILNRFANNYNIKIFGVFTDFDNTIITIHDNNYEIKFTTNKNNCICGASVGFLSYDLLNKFNPESIDIGEIFN